MSKYEIKQQYTGKSPSECYQACLRTVPSAGYNIVKKRDIASLVMCQTVIRGNKVDMSLMVPLSKPTSVVLSISSERVDEQSLKLEADRVLGILGNELGRG